MSIEQDGKQAQLAPSAARTATGSGTGYRGFANYKKLMAQLVVSAASGTTPTLDVKIQHSIDGGVTWFDLISFAQKTVAGNELRVYAEVEGTTAQGFGDYLRATWTIGGTTPSFTFAVDVFAQ